MRVVESLDDLAPAVHAARREALAAFGDDTVYGERLVRGGRHVEVQVAGDQHDNLVHLFERECSLQRRHQKILEESPSPGVHPEVLSRMLAAALAAARAVEYSSLGTVEFLLDDSGAADGADAHAAFYFLEMNTRLQVEHPVTEMVCGVDLVKEQIRIAAGEPLGYTQKDIAFAGHAIECRITAEDPETFAPSPGRVNTYHAPGGLGVRVDSALYSGYTVPPHYDSLVAKLVVHAPTRAEAIGRMRRALSEMVVAGIRTTLPLHQAVMDDAEFQSGDYTIHWLERFVAARHS
jgi:acetyl-CoA carboxylase biotin carboxylase subunit